MVQLSPTDLALVTGATGLVGSHVVEEFTQRGVPVRVLVRDGSDLSFIDSLKASGASIDIVTGDLGDADSLAKACDGVTLIVHAAAKVGDWGPTDAYRKINVDGTRALLAAAKTQPNLKRLVHVSSLGVYEARDHYGTDESEAPSKKGIDGYTLTKVEAEEVVREEIGTGDDKLPGVVLRPGFIYGPRDRTVLPRLLGKIASKQFKYLGTTEKLMNNTYVGNLVHAIFRAIENDDVVGEVFNVRDDRLVSKQEFMNTVADNAGLEHPSGVVPRPVANGLAFVLEKAWKLLGKQEAPILSSARIKFLGNNLDYSIDKAKAELGYAPPTDFTDGMRTTIDWFREQNLLPEQAGEAKSDADATTEPAAT